MATWTSVPCTSSPLSGASSHSNARSRHRASSKAFVADNFDIFVRTCARAHNARVRARAINATGTNKHVASKNAKENSVTTKGG
jgi:hypothetical protein